MLCVKTEVRPSTIAGLGLFALESIRAGDTVYRYQTGLDQMIYNSALQNYPEMAQVFIRKYAWRDGALLILCGDDARFINHSYKPNLVSGMGDSSIAVRDIAAGEELTEDYSFFDDDFPSYAETLK